MTSAAALIGVHGADAMAPDRLAKLRNFHTLDALRGVAAVSIVLFHAAFMYGLQPPAEGQIAVDLFFVMSGFVIAYRYDRDFRSGMSIGAFARIRLIRLYPLFILGTLLGFLPALIAVAAGHFDQFHEGMVESFPLAVLMLPSRFALPQIQELYPLNYVAWSLALEIAINIIYAATFRFWTVRRLIAVVASAFVGLCVCASIWGKLKYGYAWPQAPVGPVRIVYGFGMGVLIYRLYEKAPFRIRVPWWSLIAIAGAVFFIDTAWFTDVAWVKPAWEVFVVSAIVPMIVVAAVVNEPPKALRSVCAAAGIFSYAVYSLHAPLVGLFLRGEDRLHVGLQTQSPREAIVFTLVLISVCWVAHVAYDRPIRRLLTRWTQAKRPSDPLTLRSEPLAAAKS